MSHLNISASQIFGPGRQIVIIDHSHVSQPRGVLALMPHHMQNSAHFNAATIHKLLCDIIDSLGRASANAQGLPTIITTASKVAMSQDQKLFLLIDNNTDRVVGLLKAGRKKLFINDIRKGGGLESVDSALIECTPLCILDFYVVDGQQRKGYGRRLCDAMLSAEGAFIGHVAVDRPSPKMVAFLSRHYGLSKPFAQRNNFTVFETFFSSNNPSLARAGSGFRRGLGSGQLNGPASSNTRHFNQTDLRKSYSTDCLAMLKNDARPAFAQPDRHPRENLDSYNQMWPSRPPSQRQNLPPRNLPPLPPSGMQSALPARAPALEGRERFISPMSADAIGKSKQPPLPQPPSSRREKPVGTQEMFEPPLLSRTSVPDSYRQLFNNSLPVGQFSTSSSKLPVNGFFSNFPPARNQYELEQPSPFYSMGHNSQKSNGFGAKGGLAGNVLSAPNNQRTAPGAGNIIYNQYDARFGQQHRIARPF